jgi:hypothetical protein
MDESYIHAGYCSATGWFRQAAEGHPVSGRVCGSDKGKRIIIIHAMTRDGMLEIEDEIEIPADMSDNLGIQRTSSAAVVSTTLSADDGDKEDYHETLWMARSSLHG